MRLHAFILALTTFLGTLSMAQVDRYVDAAVHPGTYPTITAAMVASSPGDRILVLPGHYPSFQFSRGVQVIGMGGGPADVVVERIAYHVSIPDQNYESLISNLTVESTHPLDTLSIHGNELAPGTLTIDGCVLKNGVFLRGGQEGFYLMINNTTILPPAGHGLSNEACWIGGPGNSVDLRNTRIKGWDAVVGGSIPAGTGLRIAGGTKARIDGCEISGGSGASENGLGLGGYGIASIAPGSVELEISSSLVQGGDGVGASGGSGVALIGTVEVFQSSVAAGNGNPPGIAWSLAQPTFITYPRRLELSPSLSFAQGAVSLVPGQSLSAVIGDGSGAGLFAISLSTTLPAPETFLPFPISSLNLVEGASFTTVVPQFPVLLGAGLTFYLQGALVDPTSGDVVLSNVAAVRVKTP